MKKARNKIRIISISCCFFTAYTQAFTPSTGDIQNTTILKNTMNKIISGNREDARKYSSQIKNLLKVLPASEQKIIYQLQELNTHLTTTLQTEKNKAKTISTPIKQDLVKLYLTGIQNLPGSYSCTGRYNTIDTISFAKNFPTALTLATRYRESSCGYYLPTNNNGPFQILSKQYGTGEMTEDIFVKTVEDYIDFAKAKYNKYQSKLQTPLSYTSMSLTGVANYAALYNGGIISGGVVQALSPKYLYEGSSAYTGTAKKHGIIPKFLSFLSRELTQ